MLFKLKVCEMGDRLKAEKRKNGGQQMQKDSWNRSARAVKLKKVFV